MNDTNHPISSSIKYSNVLLTEPSSSLMNNKESNHSKYCVLYAFGLVSIVVGLLINIPLTYKRLEMNDYVPIKLEVACSKQITRYDQCIQSKTEENCLEESTAIEQCYDNIFSINKMCYIYISEYHLCKVNHQACKGIIGDFYECASKYKGVDARELLNYID